MKTTKILFALAFLALCTHGASAQTQTKVLNSRLDSLFPNRPTNYLTDVAGIVKNRAAVNARLKEIRERDSLSLVVVTLPTIGGYTIQEVAMEIGRKWLVATANDTIGVVVRNTGGVILLVTDIRKCRVEVATGSEGYMTDSRAADACRQAVADFKADNFGAGFISIANTFAERHRAELASQARALLPAPPAKPISWVGILLIFGVPGSLALVLWSRAIRREKEVGARRQKEREELWRVYATRSRAEKKAEEKRRATMTPEQREAEDERRRHEEQAAAVAVVERERRRNLNSSRTEDEPIHRGYVDNSSSSSSLDGSDSGGYSSGGSDSFSGGGGGSDY